LLDAGGLQSSLQQDLVRLFNVRNGLTIEQFLGEAPTSLHYGLPDTLGLSPQSATDLQRWELVIARAVALYEPRLLQVRVQATPDPDQPAAARVLMSAMAALERQLCQVHFDLVLNGQGAGARERAAVPEAQP
jgi:type VI secretion system protein ImpF